MACPTLPADGFLSGVLRFVDCEAQTIGAAGYQALAAPGSSFSLILTALLTLFIALFGYRMLLGHVPSVREGVLAFVKIGVVLVLATSWPAYRTLVYDTVIRGPAELSASIGGAAALPGAQGGMVSRLEAVDQAMISLAIVGAGQPATAEQAAEPMPPPMAGFEAFALGGARILYLIGIVGAFAAVRLVAGLLLALAPFFFAFLLFDATRGLFEGWLRVLLGAALGALGVSIVLGVQLALLEPWLSSLLAARAANLTAPNAPVELLVVATLFCLALAAMLWGVARLAAGFRLPDVREWIGASGGAQMRPDAEQRILDVDQQSQPAAAHSRAAAIADAVVASQRRDAADPIQPIGSGSRVPIQSASRSIETAPALPLGQSARRRTSNRISASVGRRDQT